ncbi:type IX secretion system protein PorD [Sphingobacterium sp. MYb382]|uniref:type IX secretion system protein PorD n=1 Tax=Sphingobacterium sp. MYb382 TaxID=2745278 RepID=UPI0030B485E0
MRKISLLVLFMFLRLVLPAQELNARIEIQSPQVQNTNKRALDLLQKVIQDFMNNRSWTNLKISPQERIDCSMVITITQWDGSKVYKGSAQIYSFRPVYGTNYSTPVLAYHDRNFNFSYVEGEQLDFNENMNSSSLSSLLAFYANVIVGMDADTFRRFGGNPYLSSARTILNAAQSSSEEGWRSMESLDNRYWLINNLQDSRFQPYRDFAYEYHINGLDKMAQDESASRMRMVALLDKLKEVDRNNTGNVWTSVLYSAKSNEFVGVFSKLPGNESIKVFNKLVELDPSNTSKYEVLKK